MKKGGCMKMKGFKLLGVSIILVSALFMTSTKAGAEKKNLSSQMGSKERLKETINPRSFPILGEQLDEEMVSLSEKLSDLKKRNGELTTEETNLTPAARIPWDTTASAIVNLNDDMQILDSEYLTANRSTFTNSLGTTQTWKTPEFQKTVENSVSTTNTNSTGVSATVDTSFNVLFASGKISVTGTYDYSNSNTVTNTTSETWTVPSEDVIVEPGQTVRVEWLVTVGKAIGTTSLDFRLQGIVPYWHNSKENKRYGYYMGSALSVYDTLINLFPSESETGKFNSAERKKWKRVDAKTVDRTFGSAKYEVKQGLEMTMNVYEVKNKSGRASNHERLIESKTFSADELHAK